MYLDHIRYDCQAQPKCPLSLAKVAVLWPLPTTTHQPSGFKNEAIFEIRMTEGRVGVWEKMTDDIDRGEGDIRKLCYLENRA